MHSDNTSREWEDSKHQPLQHNLSSSLLKKKTNLYQPQADQLCKIADNTQKIKICLNVPVKHSAFICTFLKGTNSSTDWRTQVEKCKIIKMKCLLSCMVLWLHSWGQAIIL